jgi:hypothetical protein
MSGLATRSGQEGTTAVAFLIGKYLPLRDQSQALAWATVPSLARLPQAGTVDVLRKKWFEPLLN